MQAAAAAADIMPQEVQLLLEAAQAEIIRALQTLEWTEVLTQAAALAAVKIMLIQESKVALE
jgi:hypothetical protein